MSTDQVGSYRIVRLLFDRYKRWGQILEAEEAGHLYLLVSIENPPFLSGFATARASIHQGKEALGFVSQIGDVRLASIEKDDVGVIYLIFEVLDSDPLPQDFPEEARWSLDRLASQAISKHWPELPTYHEDQERWFLQKEGKQDYGPFSMREIRAQFKQGSIHADHIILDSETGDRRRIYEHPLLIERSDKHVAIATSASRNYWQKVREFVRRDPLDDAFARLDSGCFGVDAPRQMLLQHTVKISAIAIRDRMKRALLETRLAHDNLRIEDIPLSRLVRVELVPDRVEAFTVTSLSERDQPVLRDDITQWEWSVTSHQSGPRQILRVCATNCVDTAGQSVRRSHPVRTIEIDVAVFPQQESHAEIAETLALDTPTLRKLLDGILKTDADIEAFSIDYCPTVFRRFGLGMERTQKLTLLLAHTPGLELEHRIKKAYPIEFNIFLEMIRPTAGEKTVQKK